VPRLPPFPPLVWVLLAGTLFIRAAFFMVWPFLAVVLHDEFQLSPFAIGAILAGASVAGSVLGFYAGNLSDRFGRRNVMIVGALGSTVAFGVLATAETVAGFVLGAFLVGLFRPAMEAPANALMSDALPDQAMRELAFHARYFLINVGAAVGPLAGLVLGLAARQTTFWLVALIYCAYALGLVVAFWTAAAAHSHTANEASLRRALLTLKDDRRFLTLMLANFLTMTAFAQIDSTTVQYLTLEAGDLVVPFYTAIIITNALTVVAFQFPLLRLLRDYDLYLRAYIGIVFYILALVLYAAIPVTSFAGWIFATWVFSLGEAILFTTLNLQIDRMAPAHLRGTYFGASALGNLGFSFGPLIGGFLLQETGGAATFLIMALLAALGGVAYAFSARTSARAAV
jgi:MFS family permease